MDKYIKHHQLTHKYHKNIGKKYPIIFVLDQVTDPHNVGSIFRLADALGIECVYLIGKSACPPNKIITKAARSAEKNIGWKYFENANEAIEFAKKSNYKIISAEITDSSIELYNYDYKNGQRICLVVGSENNGICQEILDHSDDVIHISMLGVNSSMNVVNALAIITYQIILQIDKKQ
jgi:tRNA G18 (ribose-2'-O)-methylase SpoU